MDEYISKEMAIKKLQMQLLNLEADQDKGEYSELCENRGARDALDGAIYDIRTIKAADVQPVKHGKWIENTYKYIKELDAYFVQAKCTVCGRYSDKIDIYTGYMSNECCSHCGARMDLNGGDTE